MAADVILDAIELELEHTIATDDGDVQRGLIDLGWERYAPAQDNGVIKWIWRHRDNERARAQSGTQGANFYVGVIADFHSNADAIACSHKALDRIEPLLTDF